ncbi:hypothetical protein SUGI_0760450 [Cryptomeria japonica]|nr:hypothetical protein SUGI_0760450 [Cryptomeria japonica]
MAGTQSTLPISAPSGQSGGGGGGGGGAGVLTATPAARAFFSRVSDGARTALAQRRPWLELVDRNSLTKPESLSEATTRIRKNWTYFRINYMILLSGVLAFSLVSHPVSLFLLAVLLGGWIFLYLFRTEPLVVLNRTYSDREVLGIMSPPSASFLSSAVGPLNNPLSAMSEIFFSLDQGVINAQFTFISWQSYGLVQTLDHCSRCDSNVKCFGKMN